MKSWVSFLFLFVVGFTFLGCSSIPEKKIPRDIASLRAENGMEGIWFIQGTSDIRGPYNGELELRKSHDGTYDVVRIVTYINSFFDGLKIQEVWTGKAVVTNESLTVSYELRQADFITKLNGAKRTSKDFQSPLTVLSQFLPSDKGLATQFSDNKVSSYTEWITTRRDLEATPLWVNKRQKIDAQGKKIPLVVRAAIKTAQKKIEYDKDPFVRSYRNRPEFKEERPYMVFDPTDFEFYRDNKDMIRVVNKITDSISITESVVKRNAYAPTLDEKAQGYDRNMASNHINSLGVVAHAILDEQGRVTGYEQDGDSALWTGMYLASQAMRYKATGDEEALNNVRKSLRALMTLMSITGNPKEFARTLAVHNPTMKYNDEWHRGVGPYENIMWRQGGNNDMLKGITHGFLWASLVLPASDKELWSDLKLKALDLKYLRIVSEKPQNKPAAYGLAAWISKDAQSLEDYRAHFKSLPTKIGNLFDGGFYWHGAADWSGINLSMVGDITDIMLADLLGEKKIQKQAQENLMEAWVTYQPIRRHLLTIAAYQFAYKAGVRGKSFEQESNDQSFNRALQDAAWGLREIPFPRPNLDVEINHSLKPEWCVSPIPRLFWKAFSKKETAMESFYQGLYSYPVFEMHSMVSNMVFKDQAFLYRGSHSKKVELGGVDYLYAYWLVRYSDISSIE